HRIELICIFNYFVFKKVSLENTIFVLDLNIDPDRIKAYVFKTPDSIEFLNEIDPQNADKSGIIDLRHTDRKTITINNVERGSYALKDKFIVNRGIHAYRTDGYGKSKFLDGYQTVKDKETKSYHSSTKDNDTYLLEVKGRNVFRYSINYTNNYL